MDNTREKILAAAFDLFSEKGFASVGTRAIASRAGVNEVTLFRIFGSKRNLYIAVYRHFSITPNERSVLGSVRGSFRDDVLAIGRAIVSLLERNSKIVRMSLKDMGNFQEIDADLNQQPETLIALVSDFFRGAADEVPLCDAPERLARIFVTTLMGTVLHLERIAKDDPVSRLMDELIEILYRGMLRR